jgi:hypothetical protein
MNKIDRKLKDESLKKNNKENIKASKNSLNKKKYSNISLKKYFKDEKSC